MSDIRRVMIDVDGVLADFILGFQMAARDKGAVCKLTGTVDHDNWNVFPGISENIQSEVWRDIRESPTFWRNLKPLGTLGDWDALIRLEASRQTDVLYCTSRIGATARDQTQHWLASFGVDSPVFVVRRKDFKGDIARSFGATHSLEDNLANALSIQKEGAISYIINRRYNLGGASVLRRVGTVTEFCDGVLR